MRTGPEDEEAVGAEGDGDSIAASSEAEDMVRYQGRVETSDVPHCLMVMDIEQMPTIKVFEDAWPIMTFFRNEVPLGSIDHDGSSGSTAGQSFNLGALDPDLAALLSPNHLPNASTNVKLLSIVPRSPKDRHPPVINFSQPSPASAQFHPQVRVLDSHRHLHRRCSQAVVITAPPARHSPSGASVTTTNYASLG
jgi:hypothetical protein